MNKKIKLIFTMFLFILLVFCVGKESLAYTYTVMGMQGNAITWYNVIAYKGIKIDPVTYDVGNYKGMKYQKITRTTLEGDCYIDLEIYYKTQSRGKFFKWGQVLYIGDNTSTATSETPEAHKLVGREEGYIACLNDFTAKVLKNSQSTDPVKVRIDLSKYVKGDKKDKYHIHEPFNIYVRGYYENILIARFEDSTVSVLENLIDLNALTKESGVTDANKKIISMVSNGDMFEIKEGPGEEDLKSKWTDIAACFEQNRGQRIEKMVYTVKAKKSGKYTCRDGEGKKVEREIKEGSTYEISCYGYYLKNEKVFYYCNVIEEKENSAGEKVNDEDGKRAAAGLNNRQKEYKKRISVVYSDSGQPRQEVTFVDVLDHVNNYIPGDDLSSEDAIKFEGKVAVILNIVTNIGIMLSVIMPAIIGVKYMLGSIEERAEYKKDMVPYLVGAFLLFGICTVVKILEAFGKSINNI